MLQVKQGRRVLQCAVVGGRQVPREVDEEPEAERDRRPGQQPDGTDPPKPLADGGRDAQDEEGRRPLGEDDVLEQVHREQVVAQRLERCHRSGEEQQAAGGEDGDAPPLDPLAAGGEHIGEHERCDAERRLRVNGPGVGIGARDRALR